MSQLPQISRFIALQQSVFDIDSGNAKISRHLGARENALIGISVDVVERKRLKVDWIHE
jgi:hypothetical protein